MNIFKSLFVKKEIQSSKSKDKNSTCFCICCDAEYERNEMCLLYCEKCELIADYMQDRD